MERYKEDIIRALNEELAYSPKDSSYRQRASMARLSIRWYNSSKRSMNVKVEKRGD